MLIDDYMDRAKAALGTRSDRAIARALGLSAPTVNGWRVKRQWPADNSMVQLAALAGVPADQALMDLNTWRAQSPEVAGVYSRIAETIKQAAGAAAKTMILLAALLASGGASAGTIAEQINLRNFITIHYRIFRRRAAHGVALGAVALSVAGCASHGRFNSTLACVAWIMAEPEPPPPVTVRESAETIAALFASFQTNSMAGARAAGLRPTDRTIAAFVGLGPGVIYLPHNGRVKTEAHELAHYIDWRAGRPFNTPEAEARAYRVEQEAWRCR